jgi:predicted MPP superfamily phosphohydrolase
MVSGFAKDLLLASSIIGIWPRFIEPRMLAVTQLRLPLSLPLGQKIRIVQVSDLHFGRPHSRAFIKKLLSRILHLAPDMIVITGDFLCYGRWDASEELKVFLRALHAPLGIYAVLGNHDFEKGLTINNAGDYDVLDAQPSPILKGIQRLFSAPKLTKKVTDRAKKVLPHPELLELLQKCSVQLLDNQTIQIKKTFNLTGLGEYMAGKADPKKAFQGYDVNLPGIVLVHNPDAFTLLKTYPGNLVLSGHTHGAQINLPWVKHRFCRIENPRYKSGIIREGDKTLFVTRGVGAVLPLRVNAIPEIVSITIGDL